MSLDSFGCKRILNVGSHAYDYYSLPDCRRSRGRQHRQVADVAEDPARKPAAL